MVWCLCMYECMFLNMQCFVGARRCEVREACEIREVHVSKEPVELKEKKEKNQQYNNIEYYNITNGNIRKSWRNYERKSYIDIL